MNVQIKLISDDALLASREMDDLPKIGDEIVIADESYYIATTPSEVIGDTAIVYVMQKSDS